MKKTIALLLVAALLGVGLIIGCSSDDGEETKEDEKPGTTTPVAKYKVIFDSDGRAFADGTTAIKIVDVEENGTVGTKWPEIDEDNIGTDLLQGWFDGTTQVTRSTKITKDVTLKAKYEAALFTFDDAHTATHTNFVITVSPGGTHSTWDGTEEGDNKFVIKTGGIQYKFPVTVNFDYNDYDFVDVEYTASDVNNIIYKNFGSAANYDLYAGSIANTADDEKKVITWEIRKAAAGGFAIQKWSAGSADTTIQITKITFIQRTRYKIKFDTDGGTPATLPDSYLVDGTKVSNYLPSDVTKEGLVFAGWMNGAIAVGVDTTVTSSFNNATLKPLWLADIEGLETKSITFLGTGADLHGYSSTSELPEFSALSGEDATKGYQITSKLDYERRYVLFDVDIGTATLAHYTSVTFDFEQPDSQPHNYKNLNIIAVNKGTLTNPVTVQGPSIIVSSQASSGGNATSTITLTITKPLAKDLTGDIEVGVYIPGSGTNGPYKIKNIQFVK